MGMDCCKRCWSRVPVADRIKLMLSIKDREPGGVLSEIADIIGRSISHFQQDQDAEE